MTNIKDNPHLVGPAGNGWFNWELEVARHSGPLDIGREIIRVKARNAREARFAVIRAASERFGSAWGFLPR